MLFVCAVAMGALAGSPEVENCLPGTDTQG